MTFRVLTAYDDDAIEWDRVVGRLPFPAQDPHLLASYGRVQEELGVEARLAVWETPAGVVVKPFLLRPLDDIDPVGRGFDLVSPYQYGGAVGVLEPDAFLGEFELWARMNGVVCEYGLLNPMTAGFGIAEWPAADTKPAVVIDVAEDWAARIRRDKHQAIRMANDAGVGVATVDATPANLRAFHAMYSETMERKNAAARWRLPLAYFEAFGTEMSWPYGNVTLWAATVGTETVAMALTIFGGQQVYYHFAASTGVRGAADLLIFRIVQRAQGSGYRWVHLGGGVTAANDDTLLHFKAGFSPHRVTPRSFFRVFDRPRYAELCAQKRALEIVEYGHELESPYVPLYRRTAS